MPDNYIFFWNVTDKDIMCPIISAWVAIENQNWIQKFFCNIWSFYKFYKTALFFAEVIKHGAQFPYLLQKAFINGKIIRQPISARLVWQNKLFCNRDIAVDVLNLCFLLWHFLVLLALFPSSKQASLKRWLVYEASKPCSHEAATPKLIVASSIQSSHSKPQSRN